MRVKGLDEFEILLKTRAVEMVFQPIVDLTNGETVAFEALARPPRGSSYPDVTAMFSEARRREQVGELDWVCRGAVSSSTLPDPLSCVCRTWRPGRRDITAAKRRPHQPRDWLRAGEALSAGWLTATERGISVLPFTAPVETPATRDTMHRHLSYLNHPFLVLRLGTADATDTDASRAPRLPADQIVQRP